MIWIGIAIGIIFTSCFGMALLVIVSKQKSEIMPKQLADFWKESLGNQRNQFHAIASIADALEERNGQPNIKHAVDKFLAWPLPKDFSPDGGISFKKEPDARGYAPAWPVGTNLFTADQAQQMIEHILKD